MTKVVNSSDNIQIFSGLIFFLIILIYKDGINDI
jgi:hypothetical protein